jgi:hypothetical protein
MGANVANGRHKVNAYRVLVGKYKRKNPQLEGLGIRGRVIFEWDLKKQGGTVWTGFIWLRTGTKGELC